MNPAPSLDTFQCEAVDFMDAARGRVIYADPMGARKTGTSLSWLARATPGRTLIVAPKAVHGHWLREAARFFPAARLVHYQGSPKQRELLFGAFASESMQPIIAVTSYATMTRDIALLSRKNLLGAVVFDEAHKLKGRTNNVAKAANKLIKTPHILCVTGTYVLNHPHEMWQYLHMLMPQEYTSFWRWVETHFIVELKQFRGRREPTKLIHGFQEGHEEIVRNQLLGVLIQRELAEMFDEAEHPWIAEPEHVVVPVQLSPAERKAYDKMADDLWARLPGGRLVNAGNALVAKTRLRQFSSDWGVMDDTMKAGAKVEATAGLITMLLERGEPVIVFAYYKETARRIVDALPEHVRAAWWTGDTAPDLKEQHLASWQEGHLDVIVGTIASMGEGVDGLQFRSNNVILHDRDWVPGINDQCIGRERRSGQSRRVVVWHVFTERTMDESVYEANVRKVNFESLLKGRDLRDVLYGRIIDGPEIEVVP